MLSTNIDLFRTIMRTTVSLAPLNLKASSGGSSGDTIPALRQSNVIEKDGEVKHDKKTVSNERSSNAAEVGRDRTIKIDKDDTENPANSWERTINTPNKVMELSGSSNEKSSLAAPETFEPEYNVSADADCRDCD